MITAGGLLCILGLSFRKKVFAGVSRKSLPSILALSFTGFYLANALEFYALPFLSSSKASFIFGLSPFITALMSYLQLKERLSVRKCLGIVIGMIGYVLYLIYSRHSNPLLPETKKLFIPEFLLIGATLIACYGWTLMRKIEKVHNISPLGLNAIAMIISGIMSLIHSGFSESWNPIPVTNLMVFFKMLLALLVFSNIICYNLYGYLLRIFSSTFLSCCGLIMPLFAGFFGWVFLKEKMEPSLLLAIASMAVGCRLVYSEELNMGHIVKGSFYKRGFRELKDRV